MKKAAQYMRDGMIPKKVQQYVMILIILTYCVSNTSAQSESRPFILVTKNERPQILAKIKNVPWASEIYTRLKATTDQQVALFQEDKTAYLKKLPLNWEKGGQQGFPPFYLTDHVENGKHLNLDNATDKEWVPAEKLITNLQTALDCATLYYLTQEEKYAYVASSILYTFIKAVQKSELSDWHGRGGWLFPYDGFREVRVIGYKVPLIYDFVAPYLKEGGQAFDLIKGSDTVFPIQEAQHVFLTYANISVNYGHTGSNHSVLEAPSLVYNALAIEDSLKRKKWLNYFLTESTPNQDALPVMAENYKKQGDIWPETSQYLNHSTSILAKLLLVVNRYDPSLKLGKKYPNILFALPRLDDLVYPNNEIVRWGDGHRKGHGSYQAYENALVLAKMDGLSSLEEKFAPLIKRAMLSGKYQRKSVEALLWYDDDILDNSTTIKLPRTDRVYHAGIVLQRNLSSSGKAKDGLMGFVGGAHMVHGHAEGMNMELYGEGQVLGADHGRKNYGKDLHENYSRLFAAHNTVIVNGSSQGEGGWVNLGINTVEMVAMEPEVNTPGVSPYHSFSQTHFQDTGGDKAEATQERILSVIRTSPTTGYYFDVFRSKSRLPNEFHDYLYHNIGDALVFENKDMKFKRTPKRYKSNANAVWKHNKSYRNPGWHFFENVKTSKPYGKGVKATFHLKHLKPEKVFMQLHIPGFKNRIYSKVKAPITFESPEPYNHKETPTLLIRNTGPAWENPFVVVYEPFSETEGSTVREVIPLKQEGRYMGVRVNSKLPEGELTQYIITPGDKKVFEHKELGIYFEGTFAIITLDVKLNLKSVYIGAGKKLIYQEKTFIPQGNNALYEEFPQTK